MKQATMKDNSAYWCLVIVGAGLFWWRHYFVFGEGVKAGDLNYLVRKGYIFKTWEGRLIQTGFKTPTPGAIQSNEFEFSITNDSLALVLERASGKFVELALQGIHKTAAVERHEPVCGDRGA
ncbi:MAG: hypothetical protein MZV63_61380 [Marinilabiliales bacterium]|nr:hypothetical protein [Marinilabiliales bacterium]